MLEPHLGPLLGGRNGPRADVDVHFGDPRHLESEEVDHGDVVAELEPSELGRDARLLDPDAGKDEDGVDKGVAATLSSRPTAATQHRGSDNPHGQTGAPIPSFPAY